MAIVDKHNTLNSLDARENVILELGCGKRKRQPHWIGIDALDYQGVDIVGDVYDVLAAFPDGSVHAVHSFHFFEHVADLPRLLDELARVIKPGGMLHVVVPHFSNPYYYSDYTHRNPFGLYSFSYLSEDALLRRKVPIYRDALHFRLMDAQLHFKSSPPFYFRHGIKRLFGFLFNLNRYMREFYEENLCYFFPCYEIAFTLKRK